MIYAVLLLLELLIIYYASRYVQTGLFQLLRKFLKNDHVSAYILALIYLPGTFVHETSHFLMAGILGLHPKVINILPRLERTDLRNLEEDKENNNIHKQNASKVRIQFGSVEFEHKNIIKSTLVGFIPFLAGMTILYYTPQLNLVLYNQLVTDVILWYLILTISSQMFLSSSDLRHALIPIVFSIVIFSLLWYFDYIPMVEIAILQELTQLLLGIIMLYVVGMGVLKIVSH